jgi:hypothetical protein
MRINFIQDSEDAFYENSIAFDLHDRHFFVDLLRRIGFTARMTI